MEHPTGEIMEHPTGESNDSSLRVDFDRRLKLEFHGSRHHFRRRATRLPGTGRRARLDRFGRGEPLRHGQYSHPLRPLYARLAPDLLLLGGERATLAMVEE
jgi:hypothetical protein